MPTARQFAPQLEQFLHDNPQGVLTSFRRNGMPQLSIVTVYPRDGGVGISITENRMKFKNLLRDPRCSVLVSHVDWWSGFVVFDLQRRHAPAQHGLGRVRSDRERRQARRDDPASQSCLRQRARENGRRGGEVERAFAAPIRLIRSAR